MFSIRFEKSPGHILCDLDGLLDSASLSDETGELFGRGEIAAILYLFDMQSYGKLIRHNAQLYADNSPHVTWTVRESMAMTGLSDFGRVHTAE